MPKKRRKAKSLQPGVILAEIHAMDDSAIPMVALVEIKAAGDPVEGQPKSKPTFRIEAYKGGLLRTEAYMRKFGKPVVLDLAGLTFAPAITANMDHDATQRVGHVTDPINDGKQIILAGVVSGSGSAAKEVLENNESGYPWQASVEALPTQALEEVRAGQSVFVNGQTITGPALIARKSRLFGVAFCARGADENTHVSIAATAANPSEEMTMELEEYIKAMGFDPADLTDVQTKAFENKHATEIKAAADAGNGAGLETIKAALAFDLDGLKVEYAKHEAVIEATAFEFAGKVETADLSEIKAAAMTSAYELKSKALQGEWAPMRFEIEAIKAAADMKVSLIQKERPVGPAIHASNKDFSGEVVEAAICNSLGLNTEDDYKPEVLESAHKNFRRIGLQETIVMAARQSGYQGRERINTDNLREVLSYAMPQTPVHASANSTVSLSGILSNVANKMLLDGFMEEDQSWRQLADIKPVSDFKAVTSYRMLDDMEYEKLGPNGEIAHGKVGEESFTRSAETYAKMLGITRTQIINDDLGAFDDLRTRLGRGAARKFRRLFWTTFMDNAAFFTSGRGNLITGATTVLDELGVGLQKGITAYRKLKSTDDKQVGVGTLGAPSMLVVPPELEFTAEQLYVSSRLGESGGKANIHLNKYKPVVVNELSDSGYANASATAWHLFGSMLKPVCVSFLNGIENPTVESADADFNQLGIQFRGYHDFGVDRSEWLAGVKSKGAA